ncbi:MAG: hypothetical protein P4L51_05230 [Puia sp.]|nr:hypothetical protein [Puia sp.]
MAPVKKNRNYAFRLMLFISHLVLFAPFFQSRYYTVANFFVYSSVHDIPADSHFRAHTPGHSADYQGWHLTPNHLSVDKRFRMQVFCQHSFSCPAALRFYAIDRMVSCSSDFVYSSSGPSINILRGPPCA